MNTFNGFNMNVVFDHPDPNILISFFKENPYSLFSLIILTIITIRWIANRLKSAKSKNGPFIAFAASVRNTKIAKELIEAIGEFVPPWWYNPHIGTLFPFGHDPNLLYDREVVCIEGDVSIAVDWYKRKPRISDLNSNAQICVYFPGLGLSSKNKPTQKFIEYMANEGYLCAVINSRGQELPSISQKLNHAGFWHDAELILQKISISYPRSEIYLVGYSAGTNIVHKLLMDPCRPRNVIAGMSVCINQDYKAGRDKLEQTTSGKVYSMMITLVQKDIIQKNINPGLMEHLEKVMASRYLSEFDKHALKHSIIPFKSESEYYSALSSLSYSKINIPFLALQPADDPLHQGDVRNNICLDEFYENPNIFYMEPKYGNHFGFYEGPFLEAFTNKTSYTYPAKVAAKFFEIIRHERTSIRKFGNK